VVPLVNGVEDWPKGWHKVAVQALGSVLYVTRYACSREHVAPVLLAWGGELTPAVGVPQRETKDGSNGD
jgi:hypothetical protein